ncbi:DsbA family protein [Paraburkholderia sp. RL17-347-BIC-D]
MERGAFGAPAFAANDRLFWGNDRLEMLDHFLGTVH